MNPKLVKEVRDLLMRVRVLLEEDIEELDTPDRHEACVEEIDRLLEETKLP